MSKPLRRRVAFLALSLALSAAPAVAAEPAPLLSGGILDVLRKGGPVMLVILVASVVGLAIALERLVALRRPKLAPGDLMGSVKAALANADFDGLARAVEDRSEPLARILAAGLAQRDLGSEHVERVMIAEGSREVARLKRPVRPLAILATVEPLLGLLGTVLGMISTFNVLHTTSVSDRVQKLAPGIGEALYTTVGGLVAAIPFVVLSHYLVGRVNHAADAWSGVGTELVNALVRNERRAGGAA